MDGWKPARFLLPHQLLILPAVGHELPFDSELITLWPEPVNSTSQFAGEIIHVTHLPTDLTQQFGAHDTHSC